VDGAGGFAFAGDFTFAGTFTFAFGAAPPVAFAGIRTFVTFFVSAGSAPGSAPPVNADTPLLAGAAPPFVAAATTGDVSDTTPTARRESRTREDRTTFQVSDSHAGMPALHAKLRVR
jgi:hypothetical protein